jgi:hypothetical protein
VTELSVRSKNAFIAFLAATSEYPLGYSEISLQIAFPSLSTPPYIYALDVH